MSNNQRPDRRPRTDPFPRVGSARKPDTPSGPSPRKTTLPPAHEVKALRREAKRLDEQFTALCAKWKAALPQQDVLLAACTAAKQKTVTAHVEQLNGQLKEELLHQQLYFSSLQQKLTEAPLWSRSVFCQELFDRLHGYLHLEGVDLEDHKKTLHARFEVAVRLAPDLVEALTREFVPLTLSNLPFSRTSTAATTLPVPKTAGARSDEASGCGTLVSNVFVCKAPASVCIPQIFHTLVNKLTNTSIELEQRLGVLFEIQSEVQVGPSTYYARVERRDGDMHGARANQAWTSKLVSDDLAVIVTDFVDEDDKEAVDAAQRKARAGPGDCREGVAPSSMPPALQLGLRTETCMMLTIARVTDPEHQVPIVLLRRLRVHRYNLPPDSPVIRRELHKLLPYFNGDFHMTMLSDAYRNRKNEDPMVVPCRPRDRLKTEGMKVLEHDDESDDSDDRSSIDAR
ncbi:unnamed protein product [Hyaloperonospora brassicae]|uniref:THUMP domain-containing protein n=1 Tax=Hyaloperonospora brassicae TaxID=162125 RepID=A0AAV0T676_HYABA|nr:unnamed protein product [Hyaloperonospora brassicae]